MDGMILQVEKMRCICVREMVQIEKIRFVGVKKLRGVLNLLLCKWEVINLNGGSGYWLTLKFDYYVYFNPGYMLREENIENITWKLYG